MGGAVCSAVPGLPSPSLPGNISLRSQFTASQSPAGRSCRHSSLQHHQTPAREELCRDLPERDQISLSIQGFRHQGLEGRNPLVEAVPA